MELKTLNRIYLKNNPQIIEDLIQKFIFDNPAALGVYPLHWLNKSPFSDKHMAYAL